MLLFTEKELRQYVGLNEEAVNVVENAFSQLAKNEVVMPPIMRVDIEDQNGEVDVKTAYIQKKEMFAIKISSGFFNNYKLGLPSGNGMMILISTQTGIPEAILLDNGYLTDVRTAAAGAVAAKYLSKENIETVGVIGAGSQAKYQLRALRLVREFKKVLVYSRTSNHAKTFAIEMANELGVEVQPVETAEAVVRNSDTVITTTPAKEPIIKAEWLHPGLHITAMGSDAEHKQELEAEVLVKADILVCDKISQCARLGELQHAMALGLLTEQYPIIELGELTSKKVVGRQNDEQITVCDLTGTGVQDTAIALFAYQEMKKRNKGLIIENRPILLNN
ncbi:cyclodeaminase [Neobacillus sedimentimangrovi]|uniref:Cyclodeaminase n=1 Tax=Neobacillus sedimentimangrovi TaxID=2699460 RepID=A0ABS8QHZ8_9BACI|nr:cyclodeaminase [Neobacillus sedimentimangrovi]MCD4838758.1 cyclodeaminase [Neobacillus sedimentimangrovi]